jgi:hypothetical protein
MLAVLKTAGSVFGTFLKWKKLTCGVKPWIRTRDTFWHGYKSHRRMEMSSADLWKTGLVQFCKLRKQMNLAGKRSSLRKRYCGLQVVQQRRGVLRKHSDQSRGRLVMSDLLPLSPRLAGTKGLQLACSSLHSTSPELCPTCVYCNAQ